MISISRIDRHGNVFVRIGGQPKDGFGPGWQEMGIRDFQDFRFQRWEQDIDRPGVIRVVDGMVDRFPNSAL